MKKTSSIVTMAGAALGFVLLSACGGGGGPAADADSPEGEAFAYRQAVMRLAANKLGTIGGMAREEIALDEAQFVKATVDLGALSAMIIDGFQTEGAATGSMTLPAAWEDFGDLEEKATNLVDATQGLARAAQTGGFAAAQGLVQGTAGNCGGCHRVYRERAE